MEQRILCTNEIIDLEMDQQSQGYLHSDHSPFRLGPALNFSQPNNMHAMPSSSRSVDSQHLPEHYEGAMFYNLTQYNSFHHNQGLDLTVAPPGNFYYSYNTPPSTSGMLPRPFNQAISEQMPSSSSADDYGRNMHYMDSDRGPYKRKMAEGFPGNFPHFNSASSSSSVPVFNTTTSFTPPQYRGNGIPVTDALPQIPSSSHLGRGNYVGPNHHLQHLSSDSSDGASSSWNQVSAVPLNMGVQRFHETIGVRSSTSFLNLPSTNHRARSHQHYPPPPPPPPSTMQGVVRRQHGNFHPQVAASASYRLALSSLGRNMGPTHNTMEIERRQPGPAPATGIRIYRTHRGSSIPEMTPRYHSLRNLRVIRDDDVAILELPELYERENFIDNHRDMRLDIEDMSYEELLALGERIGHVNSGLTEETVTRKLKTQTYMSSANVINLEEEEEAATSEGQETESCIICQDDYMNYEKLGILRCGHEYHANCLKKWLVIKNVCPICKSEAIPV